MHRTSLVAFLKAAAITVSLSFPFTGAHPAIHAQLPGWSAYPTRESGRVAFQTARSQPDFTALRLALATACTYWQMVMLSHDVDVFTAYEDKPGDARYNPATATPIRV